MSEIIPDLRDFKWLDPECYPGCNSLKWKESAQNLPDAVALIIRLARRCERSDPVRIAALDWLVRKNLMPSVLREELPGRMDNHIG